MKTIVWKIVCGVLSTAYVLTGIKVVIMLKFIHDKVAGLDPTTEEGLSVMIVNWINTHMHLATYSVANLLLGLILILFLFISCTKRRDEKEAQQAN